LPLDPFARHRFDYLIADPARLFARFTPSPFMA